MHSMRYLTFVFLGLARACFAQDLSAMPAAVRGEAIGTTPGDPDRQRIVFQIGRDWSWERHYLDHRELGWAPTTIRLATRERTLNYDFGRREGFIAPGLSEIPWRESAQLSISPIGWGEAIRSRREHGEPIDEISRDETSLLRWARTEQGESVTVSVDLATSDIVRAEIELRRGRKVVGVSVYEYLDWAALSDGMRHPQTTRVHFKNRANGTEILRCFTLSGLEPIPQADQPPPFIFPTHTKVADHVEGVVRDSNLAVLGPLQVVSSNRPPAKPVRWPYVVATVILLAGVVYHVRRHAHA